MKDFKNEVDFPVYIHKHKPIEISANWNNTVKHASGEFIKFLFQDDVSMPMYLEKISKDFRRQY